MADHSYHFLMAKLDGFTKSFPKAASHLGLMHRCRTNGNLVILPQPFANTSEEKIAVHDSDQTSYEFKFGCTPSKDFNNMILAIYYL